MPYDINSGLGLLGQFGNQWGTAPLPPPGTVMPNSGNGVTATVPSIASQNLPQQGGFNPFSFLSGLGGFPFMGGLGRMFQSPMAQQFLQNNPQLQQKLQGVQGMFGGQMPTPGQMPPTGAPSGVMPMNNQQNPFQNFMPTNFANRFGNWGQ